MKMYKRLTLVLSLFSILALSGCQFSGDKTDGIVEDGLIINSISIGLGGSEDLAETVVNYNFNLWNRTDRTFLIKTVEPIITSDLQDRLIDKNIRLDINKNVHGNTSKALSGTFRLNTKGLDKEGIMKLEINVKEFKVTTEQVIGVE